MVEHLLHVVRMGVVVSASRGRTKRHFYPRLALVTKIVGPVRGIHFWLSRWIKAGCSYSEVDKNIFIEQNRSSSFGEKRQDCKDESAWITVHQFDFVTVGQ